jgi:hypothetical protein
MAPVRNDLAMIIYGTSRLSSYLDPSQRCLPERVHLGELDVSISNCVVENPVVWL